MATPLIVRSDRGWLAGLALAALLVGPDAVAAPASDFRIVQPGFESSFRPLPAETVLIGNAEILAGNGEYISGGDVLIRAGRIEVVGRDIEVPDDAEVIDAEGQWVAPGLIDVRSHLGVYPSPAVWAHADGNEMVGPTSANLWAEHGLWPQDPGFVHALASGVTTLMVLPGSANIFGGRGVTLRNVPGRSAQDMKFPGAPHSLKTACGENPKRVYGAGRNAASSRLAPRSLSGVNTSTRMPRESRALARLIMPRCSP